MRGMDSDGSMDSGDSPRWKSVELCAVEVGAACPRCPQPLGQPAQIVLGTVRGRGRHGLPTLPTPLDDD